MVDKKTSAKKALIIYWSAGGNTEKVAYAIRDGLSEAGLNVTTLKTRGDELVDYYEYDLVARAQSKTSILCLKELVETRGYSLGAL
jgi:flavorubredoxin